MDTQCQPNLIDGHAVPAKLDWWTCGASLTTVTKRMMTLLWMKVKKLKSDGDYYWSLKLWLFLAVLAPCWYRRIAMWGLFEDFGNIAKLRHPAEFGAEAWSVCIAPVQISAKMIHFSSWFWAQTRKLKNICCTTAWNKKYII